ncbi:MAG: ribonuclease E/G, partial [Chlamydiota bacterium]
KTYESISIEIERAIKKVISQQQHFGLELYCHPELDHYLNHHDKSYYCKLVEKSNAQITFSTKDTLHLNDFHLYSTVNGKKLDV